MSEYQYYDFVAIDRPLTAQQMAELRAISSRARITSTRFTNQYHFGDLRGDPSQLLDRYFDAFLYFANWGTHRFMLRLPRRMLDRESCLAYCPGDGAEVEDRGDNIVLEFISQDEEGGGWVEEGDEAQLTALVPLRADLMRGDLRTLYLGWLLCARDGITGDDAEEPPMPAGLGQLSGALKAFAEFMRIDEDLIAVAAERSPRLEQAAPSAAELERWVRGLDAAEKDALLVRLVAGGDVHLREELLRRHRRAREAASGRPAEPQPAPRTAGELLEAAERHAEVRRRKEAEREARERAKHLDGIAAREEELWRRVDALLVNKRPTEYEEATRIVVDLRDAAAHVGRREAFDVRLADLRRRYYNRPGFLQRLGGAGL